MDSVTAWRGWLGGLVFTMVMGIVGLGLARLPVLADVGSMASAILAAVLYRQVAGYPESLRPGIEFSSRWLLRTAIVLYGLRLNLAVIMHQGWVLLIRDALTICVTLATMWGFARLFRANGRLPLLLGVGTGICGAAAIGAVASILAANAEETALGAGMIALVGTAFAVLDTLIRPVVGLTPNQYGIWTGISLHEIAHVALAAAPAGSQALTLALLAKLGRVLLLVPLSFAFLLWKKRQMRHQQGREAVEARIQFPWFLVGFVACSALTTLFPHLVPKSLSDGITTLSSFMLTMAMVGLGLNVHFSYLRRHAGRPLAVLVCTSLVLWAFTWLSLRL